MSLNTVNNEHLMRGGETERKDKESRRVVNPPRINRKRIKLTMEFSHYLQGIGWRRERRNGI